MRGLQRVAVAPPKTGFPAMGRQRLEETGLAHAGLAGDQGSVTSALCDGSQAISKHLQCCFALNEFHR